MTVAEHMKNIDRQLNDIQAMIGNLERYATRELLSIMTAVTMPHTDEWKAGSLQHAVKLADNIAHFLMKIEGSVSALQGHLAMVDDKIEHDTRALRASIVEKSSKLNYSTEHRISCPHVRQSVLNMTGGYCFYCKTKINLDGMGHEPDAYQVDHIVPRSAGGPDHISNYVPSCRACNASKAGKPFLTFVLSGGAKPDLRVVGGTENGDAA